MCGRFTLTASPESVEREFGLDSAPELRPRFNIAPGQDVATVQDEGGGRRRLVSRRWGLVPHWARDPKAGARLINARAETVAAKPSFRDAFRRRRCLIPADGFYEWAAAGSGPKQPYYVSRADGRCFAFAGLYERWRGPEGEVVDSCTLLTTDANDRLRRVHDRMPVILEPGDYALWLDPAVSGAERLAPLLRPQPDAALELRKVSRRVNRPQFDDPACVEPFEEEATA